MIAISLDTDLPKAHVPVSNTQAATKAELGRLLHAAIINTHFRKLLLANPVAMIDRGYLGESFQFPGSVKEQIRHVHAESLEEFSSCVLKIIETPSLTEIAVLPYC
ncbi:MAG: hypothetical protein GYA15_09720 [Leptolinea sp.]|jgi:hypothetical protein|nr:hypothetical protein [Leptolinea sp.]